MSRLPACQPSRRPGVGIAGGMPGWQITLIASGAALLAATLPVLLDRVRARRHTTAAPAT